jgi:hypothetical protein
MSCTGTGVLYAATQFSRIAIATINVGGSGSYALTTAAELSAIVRPYYLTDLTTVTGDVFYAAHVHRAIDQSVNAAAVHCLVGRRE